MILPIFVSAALITMALIAVVNARLFPRLRRTTVGAGAARVSVLIPARNEAAVIGHTVRGLLAQTYPHFELLILDDHSTDGTEMAAAAAAEGDRRVKIIAGQALPVGWLGKNWACQQLAQAASGDILMFVDADVKWSPDALASAVGWMQTTSADLLTIWPTQETVTWGERLVVPLMALAIVGYLPVMGVHYTAVPALAAACGQCLMFRRRAYEAVGGHTAVRDNIVEDVALARAIKAGGLRLRMADGAGLIGCRMYSDWSSTRKGFAKNILAGHGNRVGLLLLSAVFHWAVFVLPWLWLVFGHGSGWPVWPLLLVILGVGVRALSAAVTRQRVYDAVLMPFSVVLMTIIACQSVWWHWHGGPQWKGRTIGHVHEAGAGGARFTAVSRKFGISSHQVGVKR